MSDLNHCFKNAHNSYLFVTQLLFRYKLNHKKMKKSLRKIHPPP